MASQKGDKNLSNINENERSRITPSGNKRQLSYEQLYQGGGNHNPQGYSHDHGRQNMQQMLEFISQHGGAYGATKPSDQYLQQIQQHQDTSNLMGGFIEPDSAVSFYSDLSITHQNQKDILNVGVQDQIDYISQHIQHNYFHEPTPEEFLRELEKNEVTGPIIKDRFQKIIKDIQRNPSFADINDPSAKKEAFQRFNNDPVVSSLLEQLRKKYDQQQDELSQFSLTEISVSTSDVQQLSSYDQERLTCTLNGIKQGEYNDIRPTGGGEGRGAHYKPLTKIHKSLTASAEKFDSSSQKYREYMNIAQTILDLRDNLINEETDKQQIMRLSQFEKFIQKYNIKFKANDNSSFIQFLTKGSKV